MFEIIVKCDCGNDNCDLERDDDGNIIAVCEDCGNTGIVLYA